MTFIPMATGFAYLGTIMDIFGHEGLAPHIPNTQASRFCAESLEKVLTLYGPEEVRNSDQHDRFASRQCTSALVAKGMTISVDG